MLVTHDIARDIWGTPEPQANNILICFFGLNVLLVGGKGGWGGAAQEERHSTVVQEHHREGNTMCMG